MKKLFFSLETTGSDISGKWVIHRLSGSVEIDEKVVETFDLKISPPKGALCDPVCLQKAGVTIEGIKAYPLTYSEALREFKGILGKYVDKYDPTDKFSLVGYYNQGFGNEFLRQFFTPDQNDFNSYFFTGTIDVSCLAAEYLAKRRSKLKNFKLPTVSAFLGIKTDEARINEAYYKLHLIRSIYKIVTGRMEEL